MSKKQEYVCSNCDYSTFKNSEYQKHIKTKSISVRMDISSSR